MWNVAAFRGNSWQQIPVVEVIGQPTLEALLRDSKERLSNDSRLIAYLEAEVSFGTNEAGRIGREPISVLARMADEESREFEWSTGTRVTALDGDALGLYWPDAKTASPVVIAWHEPTAVILRLDGEARELRIEYVPDDTADDRAARLRYRCGASEHRLETILDWRSYVGSRSAVIDGSNEMRANGRGFVTKLRGKASYIVGRVLRRLTFGHPTLKQDPSL